MAANNARGAAKPTRAAYAASYSRGGGGGAGDGRVTARGEKEREEAVRRGRRRKGFDRTGPMDRYSSRIEEIPARP